MGFERRESMEERETRREIIEDMSALGPWNDEGLFVPCLVVGEKNFT